MTGTCEKPGCTVADSGICLLSHADLSMCPNFLVAGDNDNEEAVGPAAPPPQAKSPLPSPGSAARRFPLGLELGTEDAAVIMRARYTYLIGVLGSWDAGKTCFLLSLYLMASRGALPPDYLFAGSQTLQGFEQLARHIRKWKGGRLPDQLADHTNLADPRQPALLHLALREVRRAKRLLDVMLTDLPGEWSKHLVERAATAERFKFLRRADGIVLVIDGPLLNSKSRHVELQRSKHLLERLIQTVGVEITTPLILLISKCDRLKMERPAVVDELEEHAKDLGFMPQVVLCAAFSNIPHIVANGLGVFEALGAILSDINSPLPTVGSRPIALAGRAFLNFGL